MVVNSGESFLKILEMSRGMVVTLNTPEATVLELTQEKYDADSRCCCRPRFFCQFYLFFIFTIDFSFDIDQTKH